MNHGRHNERGAALITAIVILVFAALFGTTVVSMVSTQNLTSVGETQSTQALYAAEGGAEFGQRALAMNLNWYRSTTDPIATPATALGAGTFSVNIYLPATLLSRRITPASGSIRVFSTARFPAAGYIQVGDDIASGEFVQYTVASATTLTVVARDATIGTVNGGAAGTFLRGTHVFPVATLAAALPAVSSTCSPTISASTVQISSNSKFLSAGTITVDTEEITYTGSSTVGGVATLTGITRCVNSQSSGAVRGIGYPVTPLLDDSSAPDFEVLLDSSGTVGSAPLGAALRVVQKTVQR